MQFKLENEMTKPALVWLSSRNLFVKEEVITPWGICDLVGVRFNRERLKLRLQHGQTKSIGSSLKIALLNEIPDLEEGRSIRFETLARKFDSFLSTSQLSKELDDLLKKKFLTTKRKNSFQKVNGWIPLQDLIVAVELKLSRVRDVIHQAEANLEFANQSYAALPPERCERILREDGGKEFSEKGIGLLEVSSTECIELVSPKPKEHPYSEVAQMDCVERFWSSYYKQLSISG